MFPAGAGPPEFEKIFVCPTKDSNPALPISEVRATETIIKELAEKEYAPQTVLHYLKFLRHVLYHVIGKSKLRENPFEVVKLPKVRAGRTRFLSPEEEVKLCDKLGPTYAPWIRLAILTGLRKSEQFGLRWKDVELDLGIITLPHTKSGNLQYVPLSEEAKGILRGLQAVNEAQAIANLQPRSIWVFPSENIETHLEVHNFYGRIYLPAVKAAGLEGVTWHTLRHTFASRLAMDGKAESTIAALLRHSGTGLVARYAHLSPSHLKAAVEGVSGFGKVASSSCPNGDNLRSTVIRTGTIQVAKEVETSVVVESAGEPQEV
jgi:integrase